jgi:hypothetical protein
MFTAQTRREGYLQDQGVAKMYHCNKSLEAKFDKSLAALKADGSFRLEKQKMPVSVWEKAYLWAQLCKFSSKSASCKLKRF